MADSLDQPQVNISDMLAQHGRFKAGKTAVVCGATERNWGDFDAGISRVAQALLAGGLARGDRVAVLMDNSVEMLEVTFGIIRAGGCAVPLSGLLTADQLASLIADSGARRLFASAGFADRLAAVQDRLGAVGGRVAFASMRPAGRRWKPSLRAIRQRCPAFATRRGTISTSSIPRAPRACPRGSCRPMPRGCTSPFPTRSSWASPPRRGR
jgi:acyl-CoA synthetase (AMP-forming)/AMP-acid ligase II